MLWQNIWCILTESNVGHSRYKDFQIFDVDGRYYCVPHGTCRNKFSQFVKNGIIEIDNTSLT